MPPEFGASKAIVVHSQLKEWLAGLTLMPRTMDYNSFFYAFSVSREPKVEPQVLRNISVRYISNNATDFANRYFAGNSDALKNDLLLFKQEKKSASLMYIDALSMVLRKTVVILSHSKPEVLHIINPTFLNDHKVTFLSYIGNDVYQGLKLSADQSLDVLLNRFSISTSEQVTSMI